MRKEMTLRLGGLDQLRRLWIPVASVSGHGFRGRCFFFCLYDTAHDSIAGCRLGWKAEDGIDRTLLEDDERCFGTGWYYTTH